LDAGACRDRRVHCLDHRGDGGKPILRSGRERTGERGAERRRNLGSRHDRARRFREAASERFLAGRGGERRLAGQHLEYDGSESPLVGRVADRGIAEVLLRAHVPRGSDRGAGLGQSGVVRSEGARNSEVGYDGGTHLGQQDVLRLDVAMNHTAIMSVLEPLRDVVRDPERRPHVESAVQIELRAQALAPGQRHHVVGNGGAAIVERPGIEEGQNVGVAVRLISRRNRSAPNASA
jgi:hypothetical protein